MRLARSLLLAAVCLAPISGETERPSTLTAEVLSSDSRNGPDGAGPSRGTRGAQAGTLAGTGSGGSIAAGVTPEGAPRVWTLGSWERALRSDPPGALKPVSLFAAGGEWESFQIAVRSERPVRIEAVEVGPLQGTQVVPPIGRDRIRVHRAWQLEIAVPTYRNDAFRPDGYPDALVPVLDPSSEARVPPDAGTAPAPSPPSPPSPPAIRALPFDLPANETHTFWIDVHAPASTVETFYAGKALVRFAAGSAGGAPERETPPVGVPQVEIPVELRVWSFSLPDRAALRTELGFPGPRILGWARDRVAKGQLDRLPDEALLFAECARLETEHRLNSHAPPALTAVRPGPDGSFELSPEQVAGWKEFLATHHVNALPVPPPQRHFRGPDAPHADRDAIVRYLRSWDRALEAIGRPDMLCYTYLIDEPNDAEAYAFTRAWGRTIREAGSKVKVLVTEQTRTQDAAWGDLYGAVDIWVPLFPLHDPESARARQALGEEIWAYTALCQGDPTPWWHIDFPLLNYRIPAWMAWLDGMKGLLYWGGMAHWRDVDDPWKEPGTYPSREKRRRGDREIVYNGEGTLLYPGGPVGLTGPVPSMRLKALRDGIEDYDTLAILDALGRRAVADAMVRSVIRGWRDWDRDPERYAQTRRKLGCLVQDALKGRK